MQASLSKGVFVLSLDTEMAWGFNHLPEWRKPYHQYREVRQIVQRLLQLMEQYEIKATWAVVGHLFLDKCQPVDGCKHPEIVHPRYSWLDRDWFEPDPCGDLDHDPCWYGPDIIERIRQCRVPQEIGCHSFSHAIVGDPECSKETLDSELRVCRQLAGDSNIKLKSFVFPRNLVGHTDTLTANGFTSYRGRQPCWFEDFPPPLWRVAHKIDAFFPIPPPVVYPRYTGGIWDIPASAYYVHRDGWGRLLPVWMRVLKARMGLRGAARGRGIFHLWFHPYNLATDLEGLLGGLEQIFIEVNKLKARGLLDNLTMGELAADLDASKQRPATGVAGRI